MKQLLKDIYDSEINISISWFWDGGYILIIGDDMNGIKFEKDYIDLDILEKELIEKLIELYPESTFTKKYK